MRSGSEQLIAIINQPKEVGLRATFKQTLPQFVLYNKTDSLGLTNSAWIDACIGWESILRVANVGNVLYTQQITDPYAAFPAWTNTGIALAAGSRPAIDGGYVWFQTPDGMVKYFIWGNQGVVTNVRTMPIPSALAPIRNTCYAMWQSGGAYLISAVHGTVNNKYAVYGPTSMPRFDAVITEHGNEYLYTSDRDAGRIIEIAHHGGASGGKDSYGVGKPIIPLDAINDVYGFKLAYASEVKNKIVVTGRLTRTSDDAPVSMDVYAAGPEHFSFGREMFIGSTEVNGKLLYLENDTSAHFVVAGATYAYIAKATTLFGGYGHPDLKTTTQEFSNITLTEAEARSTNLEIEMSPDVSHAAIATGSDIELEMAYNNKWCKLTTCNLETDRKSTDEQGKSRVVSGIGKSAKRLLQWSPDQGVYIPSQAKMYDNPANMTKVVRATGQWEGVNDGYAPAGIYNDTDPNWSYTGTWSVDPNQGTPSIRYSNASGAYAEFPFIGTGFTFKFTMYSDRSIHDIYVDGALIASVSAYSATQQVGTYTSPVLTPGTHVFKVMRQSGQSGYIDVDEITITGDAPGSAIKLKDLNKLGVLYSTARASRGGEMRGKFMYPTNSYLKPYFGVAINYYRESAAEAAARLGVEVDELEDDMFGHNGIVAIYGTTEHNGANGISLNLWRDSVMTKLSSVSLTLNADTWYWMQIQFVEGEIRVRYRNAAYSAWTEALRHLYINSTSPWKRETLGRGAIVVKNIVPETTCYPLAAEDMTLGVASNTAFPSSGTLLVDGEQMTYTSKSTTTPPADWSSTYKPIPGWGISPKIFWFSNMAYKSEANAGFPNYPRVSPYVTATAYGGEGQQNYPFSGVASNAYNGLAMVTLPSAIWQTVRQSLTTGNRTFRVMAYDSGWLKAWSQNNSLYPSGWEININNGSQGQWLYHTDRPQFYTNVDIHQVLGFGHNPNQPVHTLGCFVLKPALHLSVRGANNTVATSHSVSVAQYYPNKSVQCAIAASFSQDEDQTLEDAINTVVTMSGGQASFQRLINEVYSWSGSGVRQFWAAKKNFVASFSLPQIVDGAGAGIAFRSNGSISIGTSLPYSTSGCYYLEVRRVGSAYWLTLFDSVSSGAYTVIEEIMLTSFEGSGYTPSGTIKVSVQDNLFSVWLNGRYLHTFYDERYSGNRYTKAFAHRYPGAGPWHMSVDLFTSEMDQVLADIVVGTRGNGMSVLSELLADRRVYWRDEPDGSLYFYKKREYTDELPDIVSAITNSKNDNRVTRVRAEGAAISEVIGSMQAAGNVFVTVNARHANTIEEAREEAYAVVNESGYSFHEKRFVMDVHPGLQVGEISYFEILGVVALSFLVRAQTIRIGFFGNNFVTEMQVDAIDQDY